MLVLYALSTVAFALASAPNIGVTAIDDGKQTSSIYNTELAGLHTSTPDRQNNSIIDILFQNATSETDLRYHGFSYNLTYGVNLTWPYYYQSLVSFLSYVNHKENFSDDEIVRPPNYYGIQITYTLIWNNTAEDLRKWVKLLIPHTIKLIARDFYTQNCWSQVNGITYFGGRGYAQLDIRLVPPQPSLGGNGGSRPESPQASQEPGQDSTYAGPAFLVPSTVQTFKQAKRQGPSPSSHRLFGENMTAVTTPTNVTFPAHPIDVARAIFEASSDPSQNGYYRYPIVESWITTDTPFVVRIRALGREGPYPGPAQIYVNKTIDAFIAMMEWTTSGVQPKHQQSRTILKENGRDYAQVDIFLKNTTLNDNTGLLKAESFAI